LLDSYFIPESNLSTVDKKSIDTFENWDHRARL